MGMKKWFAAGKMWTALLAGISYCKVHVIICALHLDPNSGALHHTSQASCWHISHTACESYIYMYKFTKCIFNHLVDSHPSCVENIWRLRSLLVFTLLKLTLKPSAFSYTGKYYSYSEQSSRSGLGLITFLQTEHAHEHFELTIHLVL